SLTALPVSQFICPQNNLKRGLTVRTTMTPGFKQQTMNRAKILVVDDDREMCQFLADLLGEEGYLVETVHDGPSAVEKYRAGGFDLTITDLYRPHDATHERNRTG